MRDISQMNKTLIAILADAVTTCRTNNRWSRETICQGIVDAHETMNGPVVTGIKFEPKTTDPYDRQKVNADRIHRWLDELTKDNNVIPPNFIISVLAGIPDEFAIRVLNEWLRPIGIYSSVIQKECESLDVIPMLQSLIKETSEATQAVAALASDSKSNEVLVDAHRELSESIAASTRLLNSIGARLAR